jgi:hypothetical protein
LKLDWQQEGVGVAVGTFLVPFFHPSPTATDPLRRCLMIDMELAARGHVFIGNGFSSVSSTVTRIRLVRGIPPNQTHFW